MTGKPARCLVRVDADARTGAGHAVRCAALLEALAPAGALVLGRNEALSRLFPNADVVLGGSDALPSLLGLGGFDGVIVDLPARADEAIAAVRRASSVPVVAVDDFGGALRADLVVNGTGPGAQHSYEGLGPGARVLCGARYALVRPCFRAARRRATPGTGGLVIAAGSGPRAGNWVRGLLAQDLSAFAPVSLVVGATFAGAAALAPRCRERGIALHRAIDGHRLAALLANARLALVTGGMLAYESLATGAPTIVFPHLEATRAECRWLAARGAALDLGFEQGSDPGAVRHALSALSADDGARRNLATRGASTVDGLGVGRAADVIRHLLAEHASDAPSHALVGACP